MTLLTLCDCNRTGCFPIACGWYSKFMKRLKSLRTIPLTFCLIAHSACDAGETSETRNDKSAKSFIGPITPASVEAFLGQIRPGTKQVSITSEGGDIAAAIRLGRQLRSQAISVKVKDYCLSACAHFVFAPAIQPQVSPNSLVAFHGTASAREEILRLSGRPDLAAKYHELALNEKRFYREAGLKEELLLTPAGKVIPRCFRLVHNNEGSKESVTFFQTTVNFYIPSKEELFSYGISIESKIWPNSNADIEKITSNLPDNANITLRFGFNEKQEISKGPEFLKPVLKAIPYCT